MKTIASALPTAVVLMLYSATGVMSEERAQDDESYLPNCTKANTAFCESGPIILRCFYGYGQAHPGNCIDKSA